MARGPLAWGMLTVCVGLGVIACGGSGDNSTFLDVLNQAGGDAGGPGSAFGSSGSGVTPGSSGTVGTVGGVTPGSACATSNAGTTRPPAYLVFMYDRSGSMNDPVGGSTKWAACKTGLTNFFSSPASGIHASLQFFSKGNNTNTICNRATYATPAIAMTAVPAASFGTAINGVSPGGNTPTLPALQGAIAYAQQVKAGITDGGKVAVVLVTDGDPNGCNSTVQNVHDAAAAVAATIPTYVIGIGPSVTNLAQMAAGGGTTPIQVNTSSPAQVTADLEKALGQIAVAQLGCEYPLPAPPAGQTINVNAVNVDYTPTGQPQTTLAYSGMCNDPNGWHYDSTTTPTKIIMCPSICDTLKADLGGKIDIIFGCSTNVPPGGSLPN
jgi:hypothetical protein